MAVPSGLETSRIIFNHCFDFILFLRTYLHPAQGRKPQRVLFISASYIDTHMARRRLSYPLADLAKAD